MSKDKLICVLVQRGFTIKTNSNQHFCAFKEVETINGERHLIISIFKSTPHKVDCLYYSEGRNILEAEHFPIDCDHNKALDNCEKMIDSTIFRKLWLDNMRNEHQP